MKQNKRGILILASMILSIGLICGVQVVQADDGDIVSISLKDANENGKIDEVHITVDYTGTATAIDPDPVIATVDPINETISKFVVTNNNSIAVTVGSIEFESNNEDYTTATFKLLLDESDENLGVDTSETALDVAYTPDGSDSDLKITGDSTPAYIAEIKSGTTGEGGITEEDGAAPVMISATYKDIDPEDEMVDSIDVTYSEDIEENSTFVEDEWSFPTNLHNLVILPSDSTISLTDVHIAIDPDNSVNINDTTTNDTIVGYVVVTGTNGGIIDGAGNYAKDQELPVGVEGDEEEDEEEDEDFIPVPGYGTARSKQPNPNSGVTLYRVDGDPRVYVIKNKKKHWIKTPKEFEAGNYSWSAVQVVSAEVLGEYPDAETSTTELLRAVGSYKVYKIENGKKRWIKTAGEFNAAGYKWKDIKEVSLEALASYQNEVSSELLRAVGDYKVYKLKGGKKYWIRTIGEFNAAGYNWEDVEEVTTETLDDYPDSN
ncbi:hypothetical protein KAT63_04085 [Candidatus Parcubacteria bacterium]|nr:hypothetical protein [Candidatus Parcubacteria bacterium]